MMQPANVRQFALSLLAYKGALVEEGERDAGVLFGNELAATLGMNEYERLVFDPAADATGSVRVDYDAPSFEAMGRLTGAMNRMAFVTVDDLELRTIDPEKELERGLSLQNGVYRFRECTPIMHHYFCFYLQYDVMADERSGGLEEVWVNPATRSMPRFASLMETLTTRDVPSSPNLDALMPAASRLALANGALSIRARLGRFLESLERRRGRDLQRMRDYYGAIDQEIRRKMARQASKSDGPSENSRLVATACAYEARAEEVVERYRAHVHVSPLAVLVCAIPGYEIRVQLHRRSAKTDASFSWNPFDRRIEPRCCDDCQRSTEAAALCDDRVHYLCLHCLKPCAECSKPFCRACHSRCPRTHRA